MPKRHERQHIPDTASPPKANWRRRLASLVSRTIFTYADAMRSLTYVTRARSAPNRYRAPASPTFAAGRSLPGGPEW